MENGANPNIPDRFGSTCVHLTAKYQATDSLVKYIEKFHYKLDFKARNYEGRSTINIYNCSMTKFMVAGETALHVAVKENSLDVFKLLVAHGADVDAKVELFLYIMYV